MSSDGKIPAADVQGRHELALDLIRQNGEAIGRLTDLRGNFEAMRDAGDRVFTDDEMVAMLTRAWAAAKALSPVVFYLNELRGMAYEFAADQARPDLAARVREATGIRVVGVAGEVRSLCGPDGHHPSCSGHPNHPDHQKWLEGKGAGPHTPAARTAGFQPPKKGEA